MRVLTHAAELSPFDGCAFVPTMGALHEGHLSLVRAAAAGGAPVVVSIFVNPTQFAPHEDFTRYPRPIERDLALAESAGAAAAFVPPAEVIYPPSEVIEVPPLPGVATAPQLEDRVRPGHFAGVCQVVARFFDLVRPMTAHFGQKDFQQLRVVESMVECSPTRWKGLRIAPHPTVREEDGLAMSSRNIYLAPQERLRAVGLFRALQSANAANHPATAELLMKQTLTAHDLEIQYAVVRDANSLMPVSDFSRPTRALIAVKLGAVRLIDNAALTVLR